MNFPTQTGLTSTSPDRQPAPGASFVRGKSGYAPFWPGGLDAIVTKSDEGGSKGSASEAKGLRTVPPGLKRGLRLSTDQDRDSTSSEKYDPGHDEHEIAAESPVAILPRLEHASDLRICNSPRCNATARSSKNSIHQTYHQPSLQKLITYYQPR